MNQFIENLVNRTLKNLIGEEYEQGMRREYKHNANNTRMIEIDWVTEGNVSHVGLFSVDTGGVLIPIFEYWRGMTVGEIKSSIDFHAVPTDESDAKVLYGQYNADGTRFFSGGRYASDGSTQQSRKYLISTGLLSTDQLPEYIDMDAVIAAFIEDAVSDSPSFEPPSLVPLPGSAEIAVTN